MIEKCPIPGGIRGSEERGVGGHAEARLAGGADRGHGHVVDTLPADSMVVLLAGTVEVH